MKMRAPGLEGYLVGFVDEGRRKNQKSLWKKKTVNNSEFDVACSCLLGAPRCWEADKMVPSHQQVARLV